MKKIALVTGGTSGIGKEIVKTLLQSDCFVFVNFGHNEAQMFDAKKEFKEISDDFKCLKADVSKEDEVYNMMQVINEEYGHLDYLVNNAGTNVDAFLENADMVEFKRVVDVNFFGKVIVSKYAIPLLKKGENASIVNIASRLGSMPCVEASAYCAAAAAIINFTKAASKELAKYKIRVNCVSPSLTITPLALSGWTEEEIEEQKNSNPLKRLGEPSDIANTVLFLLSDKASYINGQNINVNGGSF